MACRACVQLPLYTKGKDYTIDNKILNTSNEILVHLADLENERKLDIGNLKKEIEDKFSK